MEVFNRKENEEVGTICFEVRIPLKTNKNIYGIFPHKFPKKNYLDLDSTILFWKKTKIIMETFS